MHTSVLLEPVLQAFREKNIRFFIDGTIGAAGHTLAIIKEHPEIELILAFDQDPIACEIARKNLSEVISESKFRIINRNFKDIGAVLQEQGLTNPDGILLDIGVSSMQLDTEDRGFSFRGEGPLDMRMDPQNPLTAESVVNTFTEKKLAEILLEFGEEWQNKKIARAICERRRKKSIETTKELQEIVSSVVPRRGKIHPATKTFQALRIYVNDELGVLQLGIENAAKALNKDGRLAIISFHSLEDRIVKHGFRKLSQEGFSLVTKKPISADRAESRINPRARSAKLRVIEKENLI